MAPPRQNPVPSDEPDPDGPQRITDRAEYWQQRLAVPVVAAAVLSVPAVFLTTSPDPAWAATGHVLNWISLAVLGIEALLLFALSENRRAWLRRHRWHLVITLIAIPAVLFTLFPAQAMRLLQLVRLFGTLRIRRVTKIVKAARVLSTRFGLTGVRRYLVIGLGATLAAVFAAVVLTDPVALRRHRTALDELTSSWVPLPPVVLVVLVGSLLCTGIVIVWRIRRGGRDGQSGQTEHGESPDQ